MKTKIVKTWPGPHGTVYREPTPKEKREMEVVYKILVKFGGKPTPNLKAHGRLKFL